MERVASISRATKETKITFSINLDGSGSHEIETPIGFLTHMLEQFSVHGKFDVKCKIEGDTEVDTHHTIEDTAIVLGQVVLKALGNKLGIKRVADITCPLDEALTFVCVDISGRGYPVINLKSNSNCGEFSFDMARHFLETFAYNSAITLHVINIYGSNQHHIIESTFKAFGRALSEAAKIDTDKPTYMPSSKGVL